MDRDKKKNSLGKENKQISISNTIKPRSSRGSNFFGVNPVILITSFLLVLFLLIQFAGTNTPVYKITLNDVISGIKEDKFSQIVIENDGRIVAEENSFFIVNSPSDFDYQKTGLKLSSIIENEFEEIELNSFIDLIKGGDNLVSILRSTFNRGSEVREVIVGDDYILGVRAGDSKDLLVRDIGKDKFLQKLIDQNLSFQKLSVPVRVLKAYGIEVTEDSLKDKVESGLISNVFILGESTVVAKLKTESINRYMLDWTPAISSFTALLQEEGIPLDIDTVEIVPAKIPASIGLSEILTIVTLVGFLGLGFLLFRGMQGSNMGIMQFGQSKARVLFGAKPDITFEDVAGIDEAREELNEIVDFLRNPNKYRKLGARIPKGILMVGSPGTGKTLLARAIAGEAGVPFFHTSGSEFEEMLVGAGASRVRDLFAKAKKAAPALVFIDEIDAVARKRGTRIQSGNTEQTLNQILVEMDGFEKNVNVIVLAATNRPDVLDPAILRPGRFDRQIRVELPDMEGRTQILKVHSKNKPLEGDVDLEKVAKRTVGFTGADLENILNEAAIIAAKSGSKKISMQDIEEAVSKVVLGPAKKSRKRTDRELELVAYHEAGHAVVAKFIPEATPVDKISIVSRGSTGGVTMFLPEKDEYITSKRKLIADIVVSLGGRAAEEVALDDISTGASNDIEKATSVAKRMVQQFGMSEKLGMVRYGDFADSEYLGYGYSESKDFSEKTAEEIDLEVRKLIDESYKKALEILNTNRDKLDRVAKELLEKEVLSKEDFESLF